MRWVLAALALAGCASVESNALLRQGQVRVDPHPTAQGAYRMSAIVPADPVPSVAPINVSTPAGRQALAKALMGENCTATEEGRMPMAPDTFGWRREQVLMLVRCP